MNAIPYDSPQEDWDGYPDDDVDEQPLPGRPRRQYFNRRSAALVALVVGAIGFYAGVRVEKSQVSSSSTSAQASALSASARTAAAGLGSRTGAAALSGAGGFRAGAASGFGAGGNASFGTVSSISGNALYVTESSGNTLKVKLSRATKITKSVTVGKSAVRPGDTVVIRGLNSSGAISATSVSDSGAGSASSSSGGSGGAGGSGSSGSAVNSLFGSGSGG
jgi:hypothetical protein